MLNVAPNQRKNAKLDLRFGSLLCVFDVDFGVRVYFSFKDVYMEVYSSARLG